MNGGVSPHVARDLGRFIYSIALARGIRSAPWLSRSGTLFLGTLGFAILKQAGSKISAEAKVFSAFDRCTLFGNEIIASFPAGAVVAIRNKLSNAEISRYVEKHDSSCFVGRRCVASPHQSRCT